MGGTVSGKKGKDKHANSTSKIKPFNGIVVIFINVINHCGHSQPITKIILGFRFFLKGIFRGFKGEGGKLKALPDKGICVPLKPILVQYYQYIISFIFQLILRGLKRESRGFQGGFTLYPNIINIILMYSLNDLRGVSGALRGFQV